MAWRRTGDKPLSEPMMVSLLMHIWVTRPQWVKINLKNGANELKFMPHIASEDSVIIGQGNGLLPVLCHAINWANSDLFYVIN